MRTKLFLGCFVLILSLFSAAAATNDLTSTLQKGLFEEEANRNLEAAAQAYQTVSAQFDKDRSLAATAIFRLGEIYRKQNKTNEAAAQYDRIVREFADQGTLVTLSRQNLAGLRSPSQTPTASTAPAARQRNADAELLARLKKLPRSELREILPGVSDDKVLSELIQQLNLADMKYVSLGQDVSNGHPEYQRIIATQKLLNEKIEQRMDGILKTMELHASTSGGHQSTASSLQNTDSTGTAVLDDEEAEIRRIQVMIQNSPDLINAPRDGGFTPLGKAAGAGWVRVAKFLLDNGAAIGRAGNNSTPLHQAAANGNRAMVELLADRGADLNAKDGTGGTALHLVAEAGYLSVAEALVQRKANLDARNSKMNGEQTPLHRAASKGHVAMVKFLVAKGAEIDTQSSNGSTPVMNATYGGHGETLTILLTAKANPNLEDSSGRTALCYAAENGHLESVKLLLAAKADPNAGKQKLPLHMAIHGKKPAMVEALLRANADANKVAAGVSQDPRSPPTDFDGSPLYLAISENNAEAVKLLLQFKADPNGISPNKEPVIFRAIGNSSILQALLEGGADANAKDLEDASVLIRAASNSDAVKLLLDHGAQVDARNKSQWTALLGAVDAKNVKSAELLLAAKSDVNARNSFNSTPLHRAVALSQKQLVELLLANGADPNLRDNGGLTPLDYTKQKPGAGIPVATPGPIQPGEIRAKPEELAALLRQHGALDELPDFNSIRVTRQGFVRPQTIFPIGPKLTDQFTLLETVMKFYNERTIWGIGSSPVAAYQALPFPDFGRLIIHRPSRSSGGKEQEIKVSLLNNSNVVDCTKDVPVQPGDVIEIPERIHALNETPTDPVRELEKIFSNAKGTSDRARNYQKMFGNETSDPVAKALKEEAEAKASAESWACLRKATQLVVGGETKPLLVDSWKEGFLRLALRKPEAQAVLRSSSDLSRVKVTRQDAKTGKPVMLGVDISANSKLYDDLWLRDGDVIEVPDKP